MMYFSAYHAVAIFVLSVLAIAAAVLLGINYRSKSARLAAAQQDGIEHAQKALKRDLIGFSAMLIAGYIILAAGSLMALDGALKSYELRNIRSFSAGDYVRVEAMVYNTGRVPLAGCEMISRIINAAPKGKIDGSIFAPRWYSANKLENSKQSYEYSKQIRTEIPVGHSARISMRVPKIFNEYRIRSKATCN